jgi:hypothetical protein
MRCNIIEGCVPLFFCLRVLIVLVKDMWDVREVLWHSDVETASGIRIRRRVWVAGSPATAWVRESFLITVKRRLSIGVDKKAAQYSDKLPPWYPCSIPNLADFRKRGGS